MCLLRARTWCRRHRAGRADFLGPWGVLTPSATKGAVRVDRTMPLAGVLSRVFQQQSHPRNVAFAKRGFAPIPAGAFLIVAPRGPIAGRCDVLCGTGPGKKQRCQHDGRRGDGNLSIPGRLIVPGGCLCQCSSEIFCDVCESRHKKKPVLADGLQNFLHSLAPLNHGRRASTAMESSAAAKARSSTNACSVE